jgi:putative nucleotidyltransferase with HDIG domain
MALWMKHLRWGKAGPVARFSVALAAILAVTAVVVSGATTYLIGRYVESETEAFTRDAVASHFGPIFSGDVFERPLSGAEAEGLEGTVSFHLAIYNVVATRFFDTSGKIVFSYDRDEIGRAIAPQSEEGLELALAGQSYAARADVVGDTRFAVPPSRGGASYRPVSPVPDSHQQHDLAVIGNAVPGWVHALESWVPVWTEGRVIGAAVVWRDVSSIDAALRQIQMTTSALIAAAAALLWLVLRGVYLRSSRQIMSQSKAVAAALAETERTYDATLQALSNALDVRDSETEGHSRRVVDYMELIIDQLAIPPGGLSNLRRGALLHDIGKIGVPDNVLRKPAALSELEWALMKRHPEHGARIIARIPFLEEVSLIVRHHHERWDGCGYPDRLAGEAIPLGARIFAVADSFDAMTSDRPYRRAMSLEEARCEVTRCRGSQFDPEVVDAFLRIAPQRLAAIADEAPHTHPRIEAV